MVDPPPNDGPPPVEAPVVSGDFTFYGAAQGLPPDVRDASADEGGNLYVAARDALLVRAKGARDFARVDPDAAGLTKNCWAPSEIANPKPAGAAVACDPADGSVWVGFAYGGFGRYEAAKWSVMSDGPAWVTANGVRSIQIDRWSTPRAVLFAHEGTAAAPGGVTIYTGP